MKLGLGAKVECFAEPAAQRRLDSGNMQSFAEPRSRGLSWELGQPFYGWFAMKAKRPKPVSNGFFFRL
jgi:hypothetical protein